MQFYIKPVISEYRIQEDKTQALINRGSNIISDLSKLIENKIQFVLGNPGLGKTRLLKQLVIENSKNSLPSVFIECKELENDTIESYLQKKLNHDPIDINKVDINKIRNFFHLEKFLLTNKQPLIICLDALDEIDKEEVLKIYQKIKDFKAIYKEVKFIISLRNFMLDEVKDLFSEFAPNYVQISMFGRKEIEEYLKHYGFLDNEIQTVCIKLDYYYPQFAQCAPRFLETIRKLKSSFGNIIIENLSKAEIFDKYINNELRTDIRLQKDVEGLIYCLQILAFFSKMLSSRSINKNDFIDLIDRINSSVFEATVRNITKSVLFERALLFDNREYVEFQNAEIQEVLCAKEIIKLGKNDPFDVAQIIYDIAFDKDIQEFDSRWGNTVRFVISLLPEAQEYLFQFIWKRNSELDINFAMQFISEEEVVVNKLRPEKKEEFFKKWIEHIVEMKVYMDKSFARSICLFYMPSCEELLRKIFKKSEVEKHSQNNIIVLIDCLWSLNKNIDTPYWKNMFLKILKDNKTLYINKTQVLHALASLNDLEILFKIKKYLSDDKDTKKIFASLCKKVNPNDIRVISILIETIKEDRYSTSIVDLDSTTTKSCIKYILKEFIKDKYLIGKFFGDIQVILSNINNVYDKEIKNLIIETLIANHNYLNNVAFREGLLAILIKKNENLFYDLLEAYLQESSNSKSSWVYELLIAKIMTPQQAYALINKTKNTSRANNIYNIFFNIQNVNPTYGSELKKIGEIYFNDKLNKQEEEYNRNINGIDIGNELYKEFLEKIEPMPEYYMSDVFKFYHDHKSSIANKITNDDRNRITYLLRNTVLKNFDFTKVEVKMSLPNEKGELTITRPESILIFSDALLLFKEFGIKEREYRKKLIQYLPFHQGYYNNKEFFELIGSLKEDEVHFLVKFYRKKRSDDLLNYNPYALFKFIEEYKVIQLYPFLKELSFDNKIDAYKRQQAIELIFKLEPDEDFFYKLFEMYSSGHNKEIVKIAIKAAGYIIKIKGKYIDRVVDKIINDLLSNPIPLVSKEKMWAHREISDVINSYDFPLAFLKEQGYEQYFLPMFKKASEIIKMGDNYFPYASFLLSTAFIYFDSLQYKDARIIQLLDNEISKIEFDISLNELIKNRLNNTKRRYLLEGVKKLNVYNFSEKYKLFKDSQYLKVPTEKKLKQLLFNILDQEIRTWAHDKGASEIVTKHSRIGEKLVQLFIKPELEKIFLLKGFRGNDIINIYKEPEGVNSQKPDFLISYGTTKHVILEIKLLHNYELNSKKSIESYKKTLKNYMKNFNSEHVIMVVFDVQQKPNQEKRKRTIEECFRKDVNTSVVLI